MREALLAYAERILGRCELLGDCSWSHRWSLVLRLRDAVGTDWFLKQHRDRERYRAEVTAYRRWVPALGERAPRLRASNDPLQVVILSAVPGNPAPWPSPDVRRVGAVERAAERALQRDAGVLLRRLHEAQSALVWDDFGQAKLEEFEQLEPQASELLTGNELGFARAEVRMLAGLSRTNQVPCHRDYNLRNWLVAAGAVYVIDFELSRLDVWVTDLIRLHFGVWATRPDLQEAFLDGYGRELDDTDRAILRGCGILTAVWLVIKARESGQPSFEQANRLVLQRFMAARR